MAETPPEYDVFISHASEDKAEVALPLHDALVARGIKVWIDAHELTLGDSLRQEIDQGLARSRFGVVILSRHFFAKPWPQRELDGLVSKETNQGKTVLPVWHNLSIDDVVKFSPTLADKLSASTQQGLDSVAEQIERAINKSRGVASAPRSSVQPEAPVVSPPAVVSRSSLKPGDVFSDGEGLPEMVVIPAGTFQMGDDQGKYPDVVEPVPVHAVVIEKPFAMSVTPVTFDQYDRFVDETGHRRPDDEGWGRDDRPVINVSWDDAMAFVSWLSETTEQSWRLPTESEWEYACRAGSTTAYWWGDVFELNRANCLESGSVWSGKRTSPVRSFSPNPFGLYDMHGNVWEWCADCWHADYQNAPGFSEAWLEASDGDCDRRVLRGGGWYFIPVDLRAAVRDRDDRTDASSSTGFRLARTL